MSGSSNGTLLPAIRQAIGTLAVDRVTAEVISAFDAAGIPSILLKGPSIARWLYPAGGRGYVDTDLLVQRQQFSRASDLLKDLGFVELLKGFAPFERDSDSVGTTFVRRPEAGRGPGGMVDLHRNLPRLGPPDELLWETFNGAVDTMLVGGVEARVLNRAGVGLHVVVHAVQHRFGLHTAEDLRRAINMLSLEDWRRVEGLADKLGIVDLVGRGLWHDAVGADIAKDLGLPVPSDASCPDYAPAGVLPLTRCWSARTVAEKAQWVRWTVFPSRAKIRYVSKLRDPDALVLALAYARRWRDMFAAFVPATRWAVTHPRRTTRSPTERHDPTG